MGSGWSFGSCGVEAAEIRGAVVLTTGGAEGARGDAVVSGDAVMLSEHEVRVVDVGKTGKDKRWGEREKRGRKIKLRLRLVGGKELRWMATWRNCSTRRHLGREWDPCAECAAPR